MTGNRFRKRAKFGYDSTAFIVHDSHFVIKFLIDHLGAARRQVRDFAHEVAVYALDEIIETKVDVVRRVVDLARVVIAKRPGIEIFEIRAGVDKRAARFAHLLAVDG